MPPLAIPAVSIARYANALVKMREEVAGCPERLRELVVRRRRSRASTIVLLSDGSALSYWAVTSCWTVVWNVWAVSSIVSCRRVEPWRSEWQLIPWSWHWVPIRNFFHPAWYRELNWYRMNWHKLILLKWFCNGPKFLVVCFALLWDFNELNFVVVYCVMHVLYCHRSVNNIVVCVL